MLMGAAQVVQAANTPQEEANKKLVLDFYSALNRAEAAGDLRDEIRKIAEQYIAADYIQHNQMAARAGSGREGLIASFQKMPSGPPNAASKPAQLLTIMASGDMVMQVTGRDLPGLNGGPPQSLFIFNLFRVQNGRLAEHWDGSSGGSMNPPGMGGGPAPVPGAAPGSGS
jgi:predicted SnoaL-like aldol condensation-catalyzing enzyme